MTEDELRAMTGEDGSDRRCYATLMGRGCSHAGDVMTLVAEVRRLKGLIKWAEATPWRTRGCCLWCGHDVNGEYAVNHRGDCMAFERDGTPR